MKMLFTNLHMFFENIGFASWTNSESVFNALYIEISTNVKRFPLGKINGTKTASFFHSRAATHHSFTFKLQFLYELTVCVFVCVCVWGWRGVGGGGIFRFRFRFVFIKVNIFGEQNAWSLWTLKSHHSFQN